jgi:hypothetical protein
MGYRIRDLMQEDWDWTQKRLGLVQTSDTRGLVAFNEFDELERAAVVIFDNWTTNSVRVHQVIVRPMVIRHGWFELIAEYVFDHGKRKIMYGTVPSDNVKAKRLNAHIGMTVVATLKDAISDGVDMLVYEVRREDFRWWSGYERKQVH